MRNSYALASRQGLIEIAERLQASTEHEVDQLRQRLRIGVQRNAQVTIRDSAHTVTQAYCSALLVAYRNHLADLWQDFARLVLEASYEATICAGILNALRTGSKGVFLTLLGGGASGNRTEWITASIKRALKLYRDSSVEIAIVSYGESKPVSGGWSRGSRDRPCTGWRRSVAGRCPSAAVRGLMCWGARRDLNAKPSPSAWCEAPPRWVAPGCEAVSTPLGARHLHGALHLKAKPSAPRSVRGTCTVRCT